MTTAVEMPPSAPAAGPAGRRAIRPFGRAVGPHGLWVEGRLPDRVDGPPILCLGGLFDGSWIFRRFLQACAVRGHAVYAMNYRGQYLTRWDDPAGLSAADYLEDIRTVRRELGLGREAVLVGYSIGGPLALAAAAEEAPRALVLYDPDPVRGVGAGEREVRLPPVLEFWPSKRIVEEMWGGPVTKRHYDETLELFQRSRFSGRAYREICVRLLDAPPERVTAPVLVVGVSGRNEAHARIFERYRASWYVFEGYSHGMILFSPHADVVARFAASWIAAGAPAGRRRFFARRDGRLVLRAEDARLGLRYLTGWDRPVVRVLGRDGRTRATHPLRPAGPGRVPAERSYEATFHLPAGAGFEVAGDDGVDRGPGASLYRPRLRSATLADGEFFAAGVPARRTPPREEDLEVRDEALDFTYRVRVRLPRDHDPARGPYAVAVLNDGQHVWTNEGANRGWWADRAADRLARAGKIPDVVLVGVWHHVRRAHAYLPPPAGRADLYADFLRRLLADLRPRYGLTDDPRRTATIGASYGACAAVHVALDLPDVFGLVGSLSYAYVRGSPTIRRLRAMRRLPFRRLYVDHSTRWGPRDSRDDNRAASLALLGAADERGMIRGLDLHYVVGVGHFHDEPSWRKRLPGCLEFLFRET